MKKKQHNVVIMNFWHIYKSKIGEHIYNQAYENFKEWSDYERLQFILACKPKFIDTPEKRQHVLNEMKEIFESDHDFNYIERTILRSLEKIL